MIPQYSRRYLACLFAFLFHLGGMAYAQDVANPDVQKPEVRFPIPDTDDSLIGDGPMRRADWFRDLWNARRTEFANRARDEQKSVVFFGDSITQGWDGMLATSFPGMKVSNRGISGDTTRGMLNRLKDDVLNLEPTAVVLLMGTNDLEEGAKPEVIAKNVEAMITMIRESDNDLPLVICLVMPSSESMRRPSEKIKKINQLYGEIATRYDGISVLDTWSLFAGENGDAKAAEFPDLLHPNELGYQKWAAALQPVFATLGFVELEADTFQLEPGFESLFNGQDLTGWGYRRTSEAMVKMIENWKRKDPSAPELPLVTEDVSFDGLKASPDGRYVAMNGRLVVTAPKEGRRIQQLWTTRELGSDFELRLEFRALPMADSGVFIREPQLQCRDYVTAGPYKNLLRYLPQQWNELVVVVKDNVAHCTCNGDILEEGMKLPATGPIGLEGDRGQIEYRRIRVKLSP